MTPEDSIVTDTLVQEGREKVREATSHQKLVAVEDPLT